MEIWPLGADKSLYWLIDVNWLIDRCPGGGRLRASGGNLAGRWQKLLHTDHETQHPSGKAFFLNNPRKPLRLFSLFLLFLLYIFCWDELKLFPMKWHIFILHVISPRLLLPSEQRVPCLQLVVNSPFSTCLSLSQLVLSCTPNLSLSHPLICFMF